MKIVKNKYLIELFVPSISKIYNVYLPVNKRVGNVTALICKALNEITNGEFKGGNLSCLYERNTGNKLDANKLIRETELKNGSGIVII